MKKTLIIECIRIAKANNTIEKHPQFGYFHHFSFIVQNNKIMGWGTNKSAEPMVLNGYAEDSKVHAEPEAFRKSRSLLDNKEPFECLNVRLNKQGELKLSKPCPCCYSFLKNLGCNRCYFSTDVGMALLTL